MPHTHTVQALLDNYGWLNIEDNSTCVMQTPDQLPQEFFVRGWIQYNEGTQASCESVGSDTPEAEGDMTTPNATAVSG